MKPEKTMVQVLLDVSLLEQAKKVAQGEGISFEQFIQRIVERDLEALAPLGSEHGQSNENLSQDG